jgi:hypothetical protein
VQLFASILRKDGDNHVLVTPVERVGITVDDAPFLAVEMRREETAGEIDKALRAPAAADRHGSIAWVGAQRN